MDSNRKVLTKIYEVEAHSRGVKCLDLGETAAVLVTGGQDKIVNLWALGKNRYEISLRGHNEPISCVKFGKLINFLHLTFFFLFFIVVSHSNLVFIICTQQTMTRLCIQLMNMGLSRDGISKEKVKI